MKQTLLFTLLAALLAVLLFWGFKNQPDPVWEETHRLLKSDFVMLDNAIDSLQIAYNDIHLMPQTASDLRDSSAFKIVATPFLPTMEWQKFKFHLSGLRRNRAAVIASINGSGASTMTNRMARFLASKPENFLQISCAPQFDLEFHKKYIGTEEKGKFQKGELILFWEQCFAKPDEIFVAVADNFDKINPETFFGPEIWEILDEPTKHAIINGEKVEIPKNFYFIAVTHAGVSSKIELTNEHFRRLGGQYVLQPSVIELIVFLRSRTKEVTKKLAKASDETEKQKLQIELNALQDTANLQRFVYFTGKTNKQIAEKYSTSHQLGQWSNIRKYYRKEDFSLLRTTFTNHINALSPSKPMLESDFADVDYTLKNNGLEPRSNFFARIIKWLQDTGYFIEITLILGTSLVTALAGWWVYRRREKLLRQYGDETRLIFENYEKQIISADNASEQLIKVKSNVDDLVLSRKLNYTEALYFLGFIEDKVRRIEFAKNTADTFNDLLDSFTADGVLTDGEYKKLNQFLQSIKHKISENELVRLTNEVEAARRLM